MDVTTIFNKVLTGNNSISIIKSGMQIPPVENFDVLFRDEIVERVLNGLIKAKESPLKMMLIGRGGTGKTFVLRSIRFSLENNPAFLPIFISKERMASRSSFYDSVAAQAPQAPCRAIKDLQQWLAKQGEKILVFLLDDVEFMEYRLCREVSSIASTTPASIVATSLIKTDLAAWNDVVQIQEYTRDEMMAIVNAVAKKVVNPEFIPDTYPLELCVTHACNHFDSSISMCLGVIRVALGKVERECNVKGREERYLTTSDVEFAIDKVTKDAVNKIVEASDPRVLIVLSILSAEEKITFERLAKCVATVIERVFPKDKIPSESTLRNVLRAMKNAGMIDCMKLSDGYSAGVRTIWFCTPRVNASVASSIIYRRAIKAVLSEVR